MLLAAAGRRAESVSWVVASGSLAPSAQARTRVASARTPGRLAKEPRATTAWPLTRGCFRTRRVIWDPRRRRRPSNRPTRRGRGTSSTSIAVAPGVITLLEPKPTDDTSDDDERVRQPRNRALYVTSRFTRPVCRRSIWRTAALRCVEGLGDLGTPDRTHSRASSRAKASRSTTISFGADASGTGAMTGPCAERRCTGTSGRRESTSCCT